MKLLRPLFCGLAILTLSQAGCERHSALVTVPGYAEKQAEKQAAELEKAKTGEDVTPAAPKFFPPRSN